MSVESPLTSIAFMHDGATLAAGSTRGKVYIFDLRMGSTPLTTLNAHKTSVQCVAFQHGSLPKVCIYEEGEGGCGFKSMI